MPDDNYGDYDDIKVYEIPEIAVIEPSFDSAGRIVFSGVQGTPDLESDLLISAGIWLLENPNGGRADRLYFRKDTWYLNLYLELEDV